MHALTLFYLSAKHLLRLYLPNLVLRYAAVVVTVGLLIGAVTLGVWFGLHPHPRWKGGFRSAEFVNNLSALFFLFNMSIVAIPALITMRGALKILSNPDSIALWLIAPVSSVARFWSSIGPLLFFSALPYFIIIFPFIVMFVFLDPFISFVTILYFIVVSGWSVVLSFLTLMLMINYLGQEKTLRLGYSLPFSLFWLPALFFYAVEDFREFAPVIGYWQLIFFSISLLLLPPLFITTCRSFYRLLMVASEPIKEYGEPIWGVYNPWHYLDRQAVSWGIFPTILFLGLLLLDVFNFGIFTPALTAITILALVTGPLHAIMQDEKDNPDRWALSPYASRMIRAICLKLLLPLFLIGATIVVYVGNHHWWWIALVLGILSLSILTIMARPMRRLPGLQSVVYLLLLIGCFAARIVW